MGNERLGLGFGATGGFLAVLLICWPDFSSPENESLYQSFEFEATVRSVHKKHNKLVHLL